MSAVIEAPQPTPAETQVEPTDEVLEDWGYSALEALIYGASSIEGFVEEEDTLLLVEDLKKVLPPGTLNDFFLPRHKVEEDLAGFSLSQDTYGLLDILEAKYYQTLANAAGIDKETKGRIVFEAIHYPADGMGGVMHEVNYEPEDENISGLDVLSGILTLEGEADFHWIDPESGEEHSIIASPGKLVMVRGGDAEGFEKVTHGAGSPREPGSKDATIASDRIALLMHMQHDMHEYDEYAPEKD